MALFWHCASFKESITQLYDIANSKYNISLEALPVLMCLENTEQCLKINIPLNFASCCVFLEHFSLGLYFSCRMSINMYRCINIFWLIYTCYLICLTLTTWPVATWRTFITIQTIYNAWICSSHDCLQGWNWVGSSGLSRSTGSHFILVKQVNVWVTVITNMQWSPLVDIE